jgi:hypothetical protein
MKIRSKEALIDLLDEDFAWRRKELSYLSSNIDPRSSSYKTAMRSAIVMLYSHWEGYIKQACEYYLMYIKGLKLSYNELSYCFVAVSLKDRITSFESSNKSTIHTQVVSFLLSELNQRAIIPENNVIKTGSNLNSSILKEILTSIGIDFSDYELKSNLIDAVLLKNRNSIAHGQYIELDDVQFYDLHAEIINIMGDIKTKLVNAVITEAYKI